VITLDEFSEVPVPARGGFLAVGNFDGVHEGHTRLIRRLRANADAAGAPAIAVTFDPHPVALLRPEHTPAPLAWTERNVELLKSVGATEVVVFKTGPWLLRLTAREFFSSVLVGRFAARGMVEGPNFAFGRDRGGDATLLGAWCAEAGLGFEVVEPTVMDGGLISSSRIRKALAEGRVDDAQRWLGHRYALRGIVTHGAARGAGLGFPTANLDGIDTLIPEDGVYATRALVDGQPPGRPSATHIGPNVTFGEQVRKVESHLIGFTGDLYGKTIVLEFLERLRPSRKFDGLDDLLGQIQADVDQASRVCARDQR
jgi:riboflavin kinase / FMN adenylyltransferase